MRFIKVYGYIISACGIKGHGNLLIYRDSHRLLLESGGSAIESESHLRQENLKCYNLHKLSSVCFYTTVWDYK